MSKDVFSTSSKKLIGTGSYRKAIMGAVSNVVFLSFMYSLLLEVLDEVGNLAFLSSKTIKMRSLMWFFKGYKVVT